MYYVIVDEIVDDDDAYDNDDIDDVKV